MPADLAVRCVCGCLPRVHVVELDLDDDGDQVGEHHGRCRTCGWRTCDTYRPERDVEAELAAIAADSGLPLDVVRREFAQLIGGGAELIEEQPEQLVDDVPPGTVLASWPAWQCQDCGSRYGQRYDQHGAPQPCGGALLAVTVTITRRAA